MNVLLSQKKLSVIWCKLLYAVISSSEENMQNVFSLLLWCCHPPWHPLYKEYTLVHQVRNRCVKQVWLAVQRNLSSINSKLLHNSVLVVQVSILCSLYWDAAQTRGSGAAGQSLPKGLGNPMGTRMVQPINLSQEVNISEQNWWILLEIPSLMPSKTFNVTFSTSWSICVQKHSTKNTSWFI